MSKNKGEINMMMVKEKLKESISQYDGIKTGNTTFKNEKLLVIELDEESSVPRVFYKGEQINYKQKVSFNWETATDEGITKSSDFLIQYVELGDNGAVTKLEGQGDVNNVTDCLAELAEMQETILEELAYLNRKVLEDNEYDLDRYKGTIEYDNFMNALTMGDTSNGKS